MKHTLRDLERVLSRFSRKKILVIGDLMLDKFIWGKVDRISPEAPVPVVWVHSESTMPGGASNVANNARALGADVSLFGIIGEDREGTALLDMLGKKGIDTTLIYSEPARPTILKTRVIAHSQQVVRIDREELKPFSHALLTQALEKVAVRIKEVDAVIIEDYGKGVISPSLLTEVMRVAKRHKKIVVVDPKEEHFRYYKHITSITPNQKETHAATGIKIGDKKTLIQAGTQLLSKLKSRNALVTLGDKGMCLFEKEKAYYIPTVAQEVYDVSGAGDTVIATYTLALACGAPAIVGAYLANFAAGIVVGKVGVAVVENAELRHRLKSYSATNPLKVHNLHAAAISF
jgi:D-beta-D-heptose 7-phosphate kinase/D-beta-D-heptose 1-phosphate adenosyltransferase